MKRGDLYTGPKAHVTGPDVNGVDGFYAMNADATELLKVKGKPVRLVHIDLAPGDADNGAEEFRIAGPDDPGFQQGNLVSLEVEAQGQAEVQ